MMKTLFLALAALSVTVPAAVPAAWAQMPHGSGHGTSGHGSAGHAKAAAEAIAGTGTVNAIDAGKRTVNVTHAPIPAIGWPAMTMDFAVAQGVDLAPLKAGDAIAFTLSRGADGIYLIDGIAGR
ncbi:copper-binding protein [Novispirillum sp. DQ9]|uniref:copper-binding protein n=1 Tax=Novispirillum sp. DQ9 TaxID=3398612 RepID=UPI003C7B9C7A